ncbi:essential MCU regulator, mitochondrial [Sitodiplosis mosellana]|uniref:essential MCU regulator, mitochondrial n=1 Tax=Sitodiplosis mosellana TaxID=263140 RepID=UPI002444C35B|nr:essential MCU regulator, mitochondrial [Sitodiplosis mosellana]
MLLLQKYVALQRLAATVAATGTGANSTRLQQIRHKTYYRTGAFKPMPPISSFGIIGIVCSVVPGLFIGAAISKSVANFLEENDLFVPSDDDDDED